MKSTTFYLLIGVLLTVISCEKTNTDPASAEKHETQSRQFYQLKTYLYDTEAQAAITEKYLEKAFLPGLKKQGIGPVGVFKPRLSETDTTKRILVLIPFDDMGQFLTHEEVLAKDETYLASGSDYINASYEQPPYRRIESVLMKAFQDMPAMAIPALDGPRSERIYELRSYESATEAYYRNKVDMFNAGGEIKLFDRLAFNAVFYAEVISGAAMPNLMYMTTFADQETRDAKWEAFFAAPEWTALKAMEKYKHNVSHSDKIFLYPTEYSDY